MRACERCDRTVIAREYEDVAEVRVFFGMGLIYVPAVFLPLLLLAAALVYLHLRTMGAKNVRNLGSFLPDRRSHRYAYKTQIVSRRAPKLAFWTRTRLFWTVNCTWYCPFSVGVLEWTLYLVKMVENWWCPFGHAQKAQYAPAAIDASYWHTRHDLGQLHPEDRDNPIWNCACAAGPTAALEGGAPAIPAQPEHEPTAAPRRG